MRRENDEYDIFSDKLSERKMMRMAFSFWHTACNKRGVTLPQRKHG
ncbi:hypothetical protein HMPREF9999_00137 [Alloprevotella sp. oral taxon 473 str. F0040]|nr:hypothetical protein HMPREF9999_00137 [Alloprevotella sp. oral taxon 473 str. F0040]